MGEEQKRWEKQYAGNIGAREFLRFGCIFIVWILIGTALSVAANTSVILVLFLIAVFVLAVVAPRWRPGYQFLRKVSGNKNLPAEPYPGRVVWFRREPRPWWSYIPGLWGLLMTLILLYLAIKYLSE